MKNILILLSLPIILAGCTSAVDQKISEQRLEAESSEKISYHSVSPVAFKEMMQHKDFVLIDVHIPLQEHLKGTDLVIAYNDIESKLEELPKDKNTKIVLYCKGGSMSQIAAKKLIELGYTELYDLIGGKEAYDKLNA